MNLSEEVDLEDYVSRPDKISAAEVRPSIPLIPDYSRKTWMLCGLYWYGCLSETIGLSWLADFCNLSGSWYACSTEESVCYFAEGF